MDRRETGALQQFVFSSALQLKTTETHSRNIECHVNELVDASLNFPLDVRANEVVPMELTPRLRLYKKKQDGSKGQEVISSNGDPVQMDLGERVSDGGVFAEK